MTRRLQRTNALAAPVLCTLGRTACATFLALALGLAPGAARAEEVTAKPRVPAVIDYVVQENHNDRWHEVVDYPQGADIPYTLTSTFPDDLTNRTTLPYWIVVRVAPGVDYQDGSVAAFVRHRDGRMQDVTERLEASYVGGELRVGSPDILAAYPTLASEDELVLEYAGRLNDGALTGFDEGNTSWGHLEYEDHAKVVDHSVARVPLLALALARVPLLAAKGEVTPQELPDVEDAHGRSVEMPATVYSYDLQIHKVDEQTKEPLSGAKFSLRDANGKWYVRDDDWTSDQSKAMVATTDDDGTAKFPYIDSEYYEVVEIEPPVGYVKAERPIDVTVSTDVPEDEQATYLDANSKSAYKVLADAKSGLVDLSIGNQDDGSGRSALSRPHLGGLDLRGAGNRQSLSQTGDKTLLVWPLVVLGLLALLGEVAVKRVERQRAQEADGSITYKSSAGTHAADMDTRGDSDEGHRGEVPR